MKTPAIVPHGVRLYPRVVVIGRDGAWWTGVVESQETEKWFRRNPGHFTRPASYETAIRRALGLAHHMHERHGPVYRVTATKVKA